MENSLKERGVAEIKNFSANSKTATLKIKFSGGDIFTSIKMLQMLHADVTIMAKLVDRKPQNLGVYAINSQNFDRDGNCVVTFKSLLTSVNPSNVFSMLGEGDVQVQFMSVIDVEEEQ